MLVFRHGRHLLRRSARSLACRPAKRLRPDANRKRALYAFAGGITPSRSSLVLMVWAEASGGMWKPPTTPPTSTIARRVMQADPRQGDTCSSFASAAAPQTLKTATFNSININKLLLDHGQDHASLRHSLAGDGRRLSSPPQHHGSRERPISEETLPAMIRRHVPPSIGDIVHR